MPPLKRLDWSSAREISGRNGNLEEEFRKKSKMQKNVHNMILY